MRSPLPLRGPIAPRVFCSGDDCVKRTPLYVVYPLLAFLSLVALVKGCVNVRDKRIRERALAIRR